MSDTADSPRLPCKFESTGRWAARARVAAWVALFAMLAAVWVQHHLRVRKNLRRAAVKDRAYYKALAEHRGDPDDPDKESKAVRAMRVARWAKRSKGAIPGWSMAVRQFWAGENIYRPLRGGRISDPLTGELLPGKTKPPPAPLRLGAPVEELVRQPTRMHPNMPFVVILLTPFAHMSAQVCVAAVNALKVLALVASIFAVSSAANNGRHRMDEWVVGLAVLFAVPLIISDMQHGNTNMFVLAALAGHLWLYRRGDDFAAGAVLAMAVCLKMTPALFGVYWLYQRNWKLLAGLVVTLGAAVIAVPMLALGRVRYGELTGSWLNSLILPALLKGRPFPQHINQSLPGVFWRLMMHGNIHHNPDDHAYAREFGYINIVSLSPVVGRWVLTVLKAAVAAVMAWAIGWKKLPRDDGRRGLHYGLIASGMLILNQRTWDHHAVILLISYVGVWYALAYGRMARATRITALALTGAAGVVNWLMGKSLFVALTAVPGLIRGIGKWRFVFQVDSERGKEIANIVEAYGPTFLHFVLIFTVCVILLRALAATDRRGEALFSLKRIPLRGERQEQGTRNSVKQRSMSLGY